jgi:hypothetical protein
MRTVVAKKNFDGYSSPSSKRQTYVKGETYKISEDAFEAWSAKGYVAEAEGADQKEAAAETAPRSEARKGEQRGPTRGEKG